VREVSSNFGLEHFYNGGVDSEGGATGVSSFGVKNRILQLKPLELGEG